MRHGVTNRCLVCATRTRVPRRGWRAVIISDRRTRRDLAACGKEMADRHYPDAAKIVLVMDNLNIHSPASLYEAFPPAEAKRLADRFEIQSTPKHGSWLNMAEIALGILQRQCLDRRLGDQATLTGEVAAWVAARNTAVRRINWRCTSAAARIMLKRRSPACDG